MISYEQISQENAKTLMESESDYVILDVRTEEEFAEAEDEANLLRASWLHWDIPM